MTLHDWADISHIVMAFCSIIGLISWGFYLQSLKTKIIPYVSNVINREKWLWKNKKFEDIIINFFSDTSRVNRDFWNHCHDKLGNRKEENITLGFITYFSDMFSYLPKDVQDRLFESLKKQISKSDLK